MVPGPATPFTICSLSDSAFAPTAQVTATGSHYIENAYSPVDTPISDLASRTCVPCRVICPSTTAYRWHCTAKNHIDNINSIAQVTDWAPDPVPGCFYLPYAECTAGTQWSKEDASAATHDLLAHVEELHPDAANQERVTSTGGSLGNTDDLLDDAPDDATGLPLLCPYKDLCMHMTARTRRLGFANEFARQVHISKFHPKRRRRIRYGAPKDAPDGSTTSTTFFCPHKDICKNLTPRTMTFGFSSKESLLSHIKHYHPKNQARATGEDGTGPLLLCPFKDTCKHLTSRTRNFGFGSIRSRTHHIEAYHSRNQQLVARDDATGSLLLCPYKDSCKHLTSHTRKLGFRSIRARALHILSYHSDQQQPAVAPDDATRPAFICPYKGSCYMNARTLKYGFSSEATLIWHINTYHSSQQPAPVAAPDDASIAPDDVTAHGPPLICPYKDTCEHMMARTKEVGFSSNVTLRKHINLYHTNQTELKVKGLEE